MHELHAALLALQGLDEEIGRMQSRLAEFEPQLAELESPVASVQRELDGARSKLQELREEQSRLQRNAQQKSERLQASNERMMKVRNPREEAAVRTEIDLVRGALDADNADLRQVSEQATRTDLKVDDLERQLARAGEEIAARRNELLEQRGALESELAQLKDRRENQAVRLDAPSRNLYERLRRGRTRQVLAPLTSEGACGNCFNILPVQEQTLVRRGESLHRCEGCGVILYTQ